MKVKKSELKKLIEQVITEEFFDVESSQLRYELKAIKAHIEDLELALASDNLDKWDPAQGVAEDIRVQSERILNVIKRVNDKKDRGILD